MHVLVRYVLAFALIVCWYTQGYGGFGGGAGLPGGKTGSKPGYPTGTGGLLYSKTTGLLIFNLKLNYDIYTTSIS